MNLLNEPIFVLSQARSGSTLVQRTLNQDPNVLIQGESLGTPSKLAKIIGDLAEDPVESRWFISEENEIKSVLAATARLRDPADFSATVCSMSRARLTRIFSELFQELYNPTRENVRWGFKEIRCCINEGTYLIDLLSRMFPRAKFVLTVRHPVDQIASKMTVNWWNDSLAESVEIWKKQAVNFKKAVQANPRCRIFKYEDFSTQPGMACLVDWVDAVPSFKALEYRAGSSERVTDETYMQAAAAVSTAGLLYEFNDLYPPVR